MVTFILHEPTRGEGSFLSKEIVNLAANYRIPGKFFYETELSKAGEYMLEVWYNGTQVCVSACIKVS
jgi:hypothetical protein